MQQFIEVFKGLPIYFQLIPVIFIVYFVFFMIYTKKQKAKKNDFLIQNPSASTIECEQAQKGIRSVTVTLHTINGEPPKDWVQAGLRVTYMLLPGTYVFEVEASSVRPGVMHKSVTYNYGPAKLEVVVEASRKYRLGFDPKTENFTFTELDK